MANTINFYMNYLNIWILIRTSIIYIYIYRYIYIYILYCYRQGKAVELGPELAAVANGLPVKYSSAYNHVNCNTRANFKLSSTQNVGWCAAKNNPGEWIQIDAPREVFWSKIETKGRYTQYVKTYKVKYSNDGTTWTDYQETFTGNSDATSSKINVLQKPLKARMIRIYPLTYKNHISMKFEAYYSEYLVYIYIYIYYYREIEKPAKNEIIPVATPTPAPATPPKMTYELVAKSKMCKSGYIPSETKLSLQECSNFCGTNTKVSSKYFIFGKTSVLCEGKKCKCNCRSSGGCDQKDHNLFNIYKITGE